MTFDEIRLRRLDAQHLLAAADTQTAVKDLCGIQAQFLNHALHGLHIRCGNVNTERMVKSWTVRGTMHLFSEDDLPLFLHDDRKRTLRPVDTLESDSRIGARRKAYFAELILDAVSRGTDEREALKILCEKAGMTETESRSLFDPWGGIIRALCESGRLCHKVQEKKAYRLCPEFEPMTAADAEAELLRRYFTHFGPAGIKDAAYFFGTTQTGIRNHLGQLPVSETAADGKTFYYIGEVSRSSGFPACIFLAAFDQLMLGYEKSESIFLPKEYLREIFTLSGIVRPAILINGRVCGRWQKKGRKLSVTMFEAGNEKAVTDEARRLWNDDVSIAFGG